MKLEDLRIKVWYGEGYYSGASKTKILVYDVNDEEYLKENCNEFNEQEIFLGELDGKHSQVYGDLLEESEDYTLLDIIESINDCEVDNRIFEFYGSDKETEWYKKLKSVYDYAYGFKVEKKYVHKETHKFLNMDDYVQEIFILEKGE